MAAHSLPFVNETSTADCHFKDTKSNPQTRVEISAASWDQCK
jgi:hypothetical protein